MVRGGRERRQPSLRHSTAVEKRASQPRGTRASWSVLKAGKRHTKPRQPNEQGIDATGGRESWE
jgi:hypothetical protein